MILNVHLADGSIVTGRVTKVKQNWRGQTIFEYDPDAYDQALVWVNPKLVAAVVVERP